MKAWCRFRCEMVQATDRLWLCPHSAYGDAVSRVGAVEEGRQLLEQAGGYEAVLARSQAEQVKEEQFGLPL